MSDVTARLDLPLIKPSQAQKHVTHNEAIQVLDGLVQAALEQTGAVTPPFEPVPGTLFALGAAPTGDCADQGGKLAYGASEGWVFINPEEGWRAWDKSAGDFKVYQSNAWVTLTPNLQNLDGIGIGTTSDATNRLALASDASLLSHSGAGHQLKVNKAASGDTASLLFQSSWTGHAEMGLAGDTAFSIKVSDDGTTWVDAIKADANVGEVNIGLPITGAAVQQSSSDTSTGLLVKTGSTATALSGGLESRVSVAGTANDLELITGSSLSALTTGYGIRFRAASENTGPATLNIDALGPTSCVTVTGAALPAGYIRTDADTTAIYDGSNWVVGRETQHGSDANGDFTRHADGTQHVYSSVTLDFVNSTQVDKAITFPADFVDASRIVASATTEAVTSSNIATSQLAPTVCHTYQTSGCTIEIRTMDGVSGFQSGDTVSLRFVAIGRWY